VSSSFRLSAIDARPKLATPVNGEHSSSCDLRFQRSSVTAFEMSSAMGKQCYKCNSTARDDAPNCLGCGAPFGPIPSQSRAHWMLALITVVVIVAIVVIFIVTKMR